MDFGLLNPIYAVVGIGLVAAVASMLAAAVPFYRKQLLVEDATRLAPLDGLRGILCFAVMYHHAAYTYFWSETGAWTVPPSAFYNLLGQTAVAYFFCVTALLFWSRVLAMGGEIDPLAFLRARAYRIAPLYAVSCLIAIGMVAGRVRWASPRTLRELAGMAMMGLLPWDKLGAVEIGLVNAGVTWSLPYEWGFYLALPALAVLVRSGADRRVGWLGLACLPTSAATPGPSPPSGAGGWRWRSC